MAKANPERRREIWEMFDQGKSQGEIASATGLTPGLVSYYLRGRKLSPAAEKEEKLCNELASGGEETFQISVTLPFMARVGSMYEFRFGAWTLLARKVSSAPDDM